MKKTISSAILVIWSPARSSLRITVPSSRQVRKLSGCVSRYFVRTAGAAALISSSKLSLLNTLRANSRFSSFNAFLVISSIPSTCFSISSIRRLWSSSLSSTVSSLLTTKRAMPSAKSPKRSKSLFILNMASTKRRSMATGLYRAIVSSTSLSIFNSNAFTLFSRTMTCCAWSRLKVSTASPALSS